MKQKTKIKAHKFDKTDPLDKRDENAGSATRNGQLQADNEADVQTAPQPRPTPNPQIPLSPK